MAFLFSNNLPQKKLLGPIIFFIGLQLFIFAFSFLFVQVSGDVFLYFQYATKIFQGNLPYRDFGAYPPLAFLVFLLPRIFTSNFSKYAFIFFLKMFFINLICVFFMIKQAREIKENLFNILGPYTLSLFLLVPLVATRYDLFPATLTFLAFYTFLRGLTKIGWLFLVFGGLSKIYPFFLIPLFTLFHLKKRDYKKIFFGGIFLFLSFILFLIIFTPSGAVYFLKATLNRSLHIESLPASLLLVGNILGLWPIEKEIGGAIYIRSSAADLIAQSSPFFLLIGLFFIYSHYFQNLKKYFSLTKNKCYFFSCFPLANYFSAIILASFLCNKLFSPQFLIWLCPFIPFIRGRWRFHSIIIFILTCFLTTCIYPFGYFSLYKGEKWVVFLLLIRNFLLVFMVFFLLRWKSNFNLKKNNYER